MTGCGAARLGLFVNAACCEIEYHFFRGGNFQTDNIILSLIREHIYDLEKDRRGVGGGDGRRTKRMQVQSI